MIESILIENIATFGSERQMLSGLKKLNYLFGSNGVGKTTISRLIGNESIYPTCLVNWKNTTRLQPMVYNSDFVDRNFTQVAELKGVFTMGEKHVDALNSIAKLKADQNDINVRINNRIKSLKGDDGSGGKIGDRTKLKASLREKAWQQKVAFQGKHLQNAFKGFMGSKADFLEKVLSEMDTNEEAILTVVELEKKAETLFGQTLTTVALSPTVNLTKLLSHEPNHILKKRIIGKEHVDIASLIIKLGNSDWVRAGRNFYDEDNKICPFCQQTTAEAFARSLNDYFDEAFLIDSKAIDNLTAEYETDAAQLQQQLAAVIASPSKFLDVEKMIIEKTLLDTKLSLNRERLLGKKKEPSQVFEFESLVNSATAIEGLINSANIKVEEHNKIVANLDTERNALIKQVWSFVLSQLKTDLDSFKSEKSDLDKAIDSLTEQVNAMRMEFHLKEIEISRLEKQTTSIQPTIDGINKLLAAFGFQSFKLAKAANEGFYKLVRPDGSDAKATLSEGEKTFVTFLYFYHWLKGSESDNGMTIDRIVVFDDPVSSLDSEILFIVSSLIKGVVDEVRNGTGQIKQVFVLTHNVYFHKEVTFKKRGDGSKPANETFWVIRKANSVSRIEGHKANPVNTSYELLWAELRSPNRSNLTIQNSLRRILENYFKILGGVDPDHHCKKFNGKEKFLCKSLFSWVNDGSHSAHDDLYVSSDDSTVASYLMVFRSIFENSGHGAHYRMMMGEEFEQDASLAATS